MLKPRYKILLSYFFLLCSCFLQAQNPDIKRTYNWYFGDYAGLSFNTGTVAAITTGQLQSDNSASISDTVGNLLLYTDGTYVWNKNNQLMPNGNGLGGFGYGRDIVVPQPGNDSLYYIFTTQVNPPPYTGLLYSIVNMKLQGGLGDVMVKNDTILKDSWEKLAAVKHANGTDVWITANKMYTNNTYCYLLTATGFDTANHVINSIGNTDINGVFNTKFSASGKKYVNPLKDTLQVFDFDASTGILSNLIKIANTTYTNNGTFYWEEFSPDESKLYFADDIAISTPQYPNGINLLYQVNLAAGSAAAINSSLTFIDTISKSPGGGIQRASDGYLYTGRCSKSSLGRINNPNALGTACNYDTNAVSLLGKSAGVGIINFVSSYFYDSTLLAGVNQVSGIKYQVSVYPNPSTGIIHIACTDAKCTQALDEITGINMINTLGQIIKQYKNQDIEYSIDASDLPNGIYIIEINSSQYQTKQKLIINK